MIRIVGHAPSDGALVDVTLDQTPLIDAMWRISAQFPHAVADRLGGGHLRALGGALVDGDPAGAAAHFEHHGVRRAAAGQRRRSICGELRNDEIGRAEAALAAMQGSLARELAQRKRLAELGMAVARINHDLRNMLSAAQLISDRLATIPDPLAQRLAPRLVATLDRAILFCQSTLTYGGGARTGARRRARFDLRELVRQIVETAEAQQPRRDRLYDRHSPEFRTASPIRITCCGSSRISAATRRRRCAAMARRAGGRRRSASPRSGPTASR